MNNNVSFMIHEINSDDCRDKNRYYCTVCNERIHCDQRYKWGTDARTPQH